MKKIFKYCLGFFLVFFISFMFFPKTVKADIGPKPSVCIDVVGASNFKYTITLIALHPTGPYRDRAEVDPDASDYHPIMSYKDSEGYRWVGRHDSLVGNGRFTWGYYPPAEFKILILTEDGRYYSSDVVKSYAFKTYYKIDLSKTNFDGINNIYKINSVTKNYKYGIELTNFVIRVIFTILIEMGLALLFKYRTKRHLIIILIVNLITQIILNTSVNIAAYYEGYFLAIFIFILAEIIILFLESTIYALVFRKEGSFKGMLYGILANLLSFTVGFVLFLSTIK